MYSINVIYVLAHGFPKQCNNFFQSDSDIIINRVWSEKNMTLLQEFMCQLPEIGMIWSKKIRSWSQIRRAILCQLHILHFITTYTITYILYFRNTEQAFLFWTQIGKYDATSVFFSEFSRLKIAWTKTQLSYAKNQTNY